jgi:hypothetical protein
MRPRRTIQARRAAATVASAVGAALILQACGGSSSSSSTTATSSTASHTSSSVTASSAAGGVSAQSVERALRVHGGPPAPTAAQCHASSATERSAAPFGHTSLPIFTCELTVSGHSGRYAVQVLPNGCFVAERLGGGQSVQGCGVKRS